MAHAPTAIRPLRADELPVAQHVLARAFHDDPMMRYVIPDDHVRPRALQTLMGFFVRPSLSGGRILATTERSGVAAVLDPGKTSLSPGQVVRAGLLGTVARLGLASTRRLLAVERVGTRLHRVMGDQPHLYLAVLGVDPAHRGTGLGGRLLEATVARAEAQGVPTYLETMNERNVTLYERYGFEVVGHDDSFGGQMGVWGMRRRAPAA
jgi:ribosomal protein S18 acetylase RimI-like enzyme